MSILATSFNMVLDILARTITSERNKRDSKTISTHIDMIYVENPKKSTQRKGDLINKLSKVIGYKNNIKNQL
jgi:hypothetical protein